jgi:hypothetical protein
MSSNNRTPSGPAIHLYNIVHFLTLVSSVYSDMMRMGVWFNLGCQCLWSTAWSWGDLSSNPFSWNTKKAYVVYINFSFGMTKAENRLIVLLWTSKCQTLSLQWHKYASCVYNEGHMKSIVNVQHPCNFQWRHVVGHVVSWIPCNLVMVGLHFECQVSCGSEKAS